MTTAKCRWSGPRGQPRPLRCDPLAGPPPAEQSEGETPLLTKLPLYPTNAGCHASGPIRRPVIGLGHPVFSFPNLLTMSPWEINKAISACEAVLAPGGFGVFYLLPALPTPTRGVTHWLIGSYQQLTQLATAIRNNSELQFFLSEHSIRLGLRDSDVPPAFIPYQKGYGTNIPGKNLGVKSQILRTNSIAITERVIVRPGQRITDLWQNIANFWNSQTPQSHHIVEFNHLRKIGVSQRSGDDPLDHAQLPCVLLSAEFHQRYISLILKGTHHLDKDELTAGMPHAYHDLYVRRSVLFEPLWSVSKIILETAKVPIKLIV